MKDKKTSSHKKRAIGLLVLAVLCIGGAELVACYFFAPPLYLKITAPVRNGIHVTVEFCSHMTTELSDWWSAVTTAKESLPETDMQIAGAPAILTDAPLSDPALTELKQVGGQEILTGGTIEIIYYDQADEQWADQLYGTDNIGRYGCGPVAMSMVVASMTGQDSDPVQMAALAYDKGYWADSSGSYLSIVEGISAIYGLSATPIQAQTPEAIQDALLTGNLLVALMGPGHFTSKGHFILIRGVTLSGTVLVADPNSKERSLMEWDPQLILDELSASTSDGAPLWVISNQVS